MRYATFLLLLTSAAWAQSEAGWQLVWGDDFNGAANSAPNPKNWTYDIGAGGWGNQELETYTDSTQNSFLDGNGNLVIQALKTAGSYTSARLKTQGLFSIAYGKVEARIRIPFGQGLWPAFWMLGNNIDTVSWPSCGEIDIMENIGKEPSIVHGTVHGTGDTGAGIGGPYTLPGGAVFSADFHVFSVVWSPTSVQFYVDDNLYETVTPATAGQQWVFDHPFFLIMNVAVGGSWPGNPDSTTTFPQTMTVDYVHVYRSTTQPIIEPEQNGVENAADFSGNMAPGSLASVYGTGLADNTYQNLFDSTMNAFPPSVAGVSVSINGKFAPLTYVSPNQINFQVPWETPVSPASTSVYVLRNQTSSNTQNLSFIPVSPSAFAQDDTAIVTCYNNGGRIQAGSVCAIWGNGFGPKQTSYPDGGPAPSALDPVTASTCTLTIAGQAAQVEYCGAAPTLIIDQLNFVYPSGVPPNAGPTVAATLQVGQATATLTFPAPAQ